MENITKKIDSFVENFPIIRHDVTWVDNIKADCGKISVEYNMSTAFSWMIQAAGTCRFYASDVIYDIEAIKQEIDAFARNIWNGIHNETYVRYIGIREMGVDSNSFIHNKIDPEGSWRFGEKEFCKHYSRLFKVTITEVEKYGKQVIDVVTDEIGLNVSTDDETA